MSTYIAATAPTTTTESWYETRDQPKARWEKDNGGWAEGKSHLTTYYEGQGVAFDPFEWWPAVYCTFIEYVGPDAQFAKVDIPSGDHNWFHEPEGEYIVPECYLTPQ